MKEMCGCHLRSFDVLPDAKPNLFAKMNRKALKRVLPFLDTIKNIRPKQRVLLFSHLDNQTRDLLYASLTYLLTSPKVPVGTRLMLKKKLAPLRESFQTLINRGSSVSKKKKTLIQIGGAPSMTYAIRQVIPLLLDIF